MLYGINVSFALGCTCTACKPAAWPCCMLSPVHAMHASLLHALACTCNACKPAACSRLYMECMQACCMLSPVHAMLQACCMLSAIHAMHASLLHALGCTCNACKPAACSRLYMQCMLCKPAACSLLYMQCMQACCMLWAVHAMHASLLHALSCTYNACKPAAWDLLHALGCTCNACKPAACSRLYMQCM